MNASISFRLGLLCAAPVVVFDRSSAALMEAQNSVVPSPPGAAVPGVVPLGAVPLGVVPSVVGLVPDTDVAGADVAPGDPVDVVEVLEHPASATVAAMVAPATHTPIRCFLIGPLPVTCIQHASCHVAEQ